MNSILNETRIFNNEELHDFLDRFSIEDHRVGQTQKKKPVNDFLRNLYFSFLGLKNARHDNKKMIDGRSLKNVLLFRYDLIGDYIISTPVVRWLKAMNPHVHIDVVTSVRNDFFVKKDPNIHATYPIPYSRKSLLFMKDAVKSARKTRYDAVIALIFTNMTKAGTLATRIAPQAEKITIAHRERGQIYRKVFNRQVEHYCWKEHWSQTMLRMAEEIIEFDGPAPEKAKNPYIYFYDRDLETALGLAAQYDLEYSIQRENIIIPHVTSLTVRQGRPYCIVNKSASDKDRQLSNAPAIAICKALVDKYKDIQVFITGAPQDSGDIKMIAEYTGSPRCSPLLVDLTEFIAFTSGARFVVSGDTSTVHIAAAARVPVVGLYSSLEKVSEWYPFNTRFSVVLSQKPGTLDSIETSKVIEAVDRLGLK